ncbi:MAG: hypothetical protein GX443_03250 [Deltaproteobacteria bacterium]|nr:hypothetical protein [Deltaproteobacteria bacterium]
MPQKLRLLDLFEGKRYHKVILLVSVLAFLFLELLVYLAAASQSGEKSRVTILDAAGKKVYETSGTTLTSYEKHVFESNNGPLRNYQLQVRTETHPFPFRAWLTAAIGIPVGLILLMAFLVKAYLSLVYGEGGEASPEADGSSSRQKGRLESLSFAFQGFSVFHVGFVILLGVLTLWMIPNFLGDFARIAAVAVRDYQWFFLGTAVFLGILILWVIYLRYRLSKQMLENQLHLEKYRLEQQLLLQRETPQLLPNPVSEAQEH